MTLIKLGQAFTLLISFCFFVPMSRADEKGEVVYNADKTQWAYWMSHGEDSTKRYQMVWHLDSGKELMGPEFGYVWDVTFRSDGQQIAYCAGMKNENGKVIYFVVYFNRDGTLVRGPSDFRFVASTHFSNDGSYLIYRAELEAERYQTIISDSRGQILRRGPLANYVFDIIMSPSGNRFAYWIEAKPHVVQVVIGDRLQDSVGPEFVGILQDLKYSPDGDPTFSKDGQHIYYKALHASYGEVLVIDHQIQKP